MFAWRACTSVALALSLMAMADARAQPASSNPPAIPPAAGAPLEFERIGADLGPISDRDRRVETFRFTNVSGRAVTLRIGGCHFCGVPTTDKPTYQPGESGVVMVDVDPSNRRGVLRAGGHISIDEIPGYTQSIDVVAEVRPLVWIEPEQVTINEHPRGSPASAEVLFHARRGAKVVAIEPRRADLVATIGTTREAAHPDDPGDQFVVTPLMFTLPGTLTTGEHEGEAVVVTDDPGSPRHTVTLRVRVEGEAVATPSTILLGRVRPGEGVVGETRVRSRSGGVLRVVSLEVSDRGLLEQMALDVFHAGPDGEVIVRVAAVAPLRTIRYGESSIALTTRAADGELETLIIPVGISVRHAETPEER